MRAQMARSRNIENSSVHESLLPRDQVSMAQNTGLFDLTAIAPNATNIHGVNADMRMQRRMFMQDSIN